MDKSHNERNRAETERLKALVGPLSDADLGRPVGDGGWTVAVALAHVAYWDGRTLGVLEASTRHGIRRSWWAAAEADAVNDARLEAWRSTPPREAAEEAVRNAETVDRVVAELPAEVVEALRTERPLALERARHRGAHLDEIEQALGRA